MKITWRDKSTILMAFAAVFLCGYGVGHIVRDRQIPPPHAAHERPAWQEETLQSLKETLSLRPEQIPLVERELAQAAKAIDLGHQGVVLEDHRHLLRLYEKLMELLDEDQGALLLEEKNALDMRINVLSQ